LRWSASAGATTAERLTATNYRCGVIYVRKREWKKRTDRSLFGACSKRNRKLSWYKEQSWGVEKAVPSPKKGFGRAVPRKERMSERGAANAEK